MKNKKYKYPQSEKIFTLKKVVNTIYHFTCGHWCTDSVFTDLIDIKTGLAEWQKPKQLKLF
jgi:hypothetical protein